MKRILSLLFVASLSMSQPAVADLRLASAGIWEPGQDRNIVAVGAWEVEIPAALHSDVFTGTGVYHATVVDPLHTVVFAVARSFALNWRPDGDVRPEPTPDEKRTELAQLTELGIAYQSQSLLRGNSDRISGVSIRRLSPAELPVASFCGGHAWSATDTGVEGQDGRPFTLRGRTVFCFDYVDSGQAPIDFVEVHLSERYCGSAGHVPLVGFDPMAIAIFRSMRYTRGPAHRPPQVPPGASQIGQGVGLIGQGFVAPWNATPDPVDYCRG